MSADVGAFGLPVFSSGSTATTAGVTTAASGSSFVIFLNDSGSGTRSVSDNKSNTYTQIGVTGSFFGGASNTSVWLKINGAGGTGHTATGTLTGGTFLEVHGPFEITGGALASLVEAFPATMWNDDTATPFTSNSVTTANADDLLLSFTATGTSSGTETLTYANGFVPVTADGNSAQFSGGVAKRVGVAPGTYFSQFTSAGAGTTEALITVIAFKSAAGGGVVNTKSQTETLLVADQSTKVRRSTRALVEAIASMSDTLTKLSNNIRVKSIAEAIDMADQNIKLMKLTRSILDAFAVDTDNAAKVNSTFLGEAISIIDQLNGRIIRGRSISEAISLADSQIRVLVRVRGIIETLVAADILTDFALHSRAIIDAVSVIDLLTSIKTGGQINTRSLLESLVVADQLSQFSRFYRAAIDPLSPTDAESRTVVANRQQTDSALITDSEQSFVFRNRTQTDNVGLTDAEQAFRVLNRQVVDPFAIIDILLGTHTGSQVYTLSIVDTLVAIDQLLKVQKLTRSQIDTFPVIDLILAQFLPFVTPGLVQVRIQLGMYDGVYLSAMDPVRLGANDPIYLSSVA